MSDQPATQKLRGGGTISITDTGTSGDPIKAVIVFGAEDSDLARERARIDGVRATSIVHRLGRELVDRLNGDNRRVVTECARRVRAEEKRYLEERRREVRARATATARKDSPAPSEARDVHSTSGDAAQMDLDQFELTAQEHG